LSETGFDGLAFVRAIQEGRAVVGAPPWAVALKVMDDNVIQTPGEQFTVLDGYVQGGLIGAMADGAQSLALMSTQTAFETWVTLDLHTRFARPIKAGTAIRIETVVLNKSRTGAVAESTFTFLADGKLAAKATGGWRKAETGPRTEFRPPISSRTLPRFKT
jgi:acyl-coenzyme A thioesterase PaaI-like protein